MAGWTRARRHRLGFNCESAGVRRLSRLAGNPSGTWRIGAPCLEMISRSRIATSSLCFQGRKGPHVPIRQRLCFSRRQLTLEARPLSAAHFSAPRPSHYEATGVGTRTRWQSVAGNLLLLTAMVEQNVAGDLE